MAGIYIHIPFCRQACHYCDFHFSTNQSSVKEMSNAICWELRFQKNYLPDSAVETIYFGGGTPSVFPPALLEEILHTIRNHYRIVQSPEVTVEANPEDLSLAALQGLKSLGVDRLSIGAQSFNPKVLKFLNRSHDVSQIKGAIEKARQVGFENLNVDLIYAIPDRAPEELVEDLDLLLELSPEHISAYSLTIEEKTVFGNWVKSGKFHTVSEEGNANQFEAVMDKLVNAGYDHYEISNYAKPGFESRHNSSYWKQKKYLGVGPSAHSFDGRVRQFNIASNPAYLKSIAEGNVPAQVEVLTKENMINEYIMTSLRTKWGCNLNHLKEVHQFDLLEIHGDFVTFLIGKGLMMLENEILTFTRSGKMFADKLSSDLFLIT